MIVPRSVNNEIFIGDYFKLRIQVLQLVTDVVSLIGGGLEWCISQKSESIPLHCFQKSESINCISPFTSFKQMEENMNSSWTTILGTKLFFWQVCVCNAKGTPLDPIFLFFLLFL